MENAVQQKNLDFAADCGAADPLDSAQPGWADKLFWYRLSHWEAWDWRLKYIPIFPVWLWLCLRSRSWWFFSAANPTITFGGFDGERKSEIYKLLPPGSYPRYICVSPSHSIQQIEQRLATAGLSFPLAVKPDIGKMGLMFRKINSIDSLRRYHEIMFCDYVIQEWINYPLEVSVFYYRTPTADKGHITGFVRKDFLEVAGDGRSTLGELIARYPRARLRLREIQAKHRNRLDIILKPGERYCLSPALNLSRGGRLVSLEHEKDERLLNVFDKLSNHTQSFYFGRYDIKCNSIEELKQGKNFSVLEYNGSGAEPHHVYGNGNSLWEACKELAAHWSILYDIARANRTAGIQYCNFQEGWKFLQRTNKHLRALKRLDGETTLENL